MKPNRDAAALAASLSKAATAPLPLPAAIPPEAPATSADTSIALEEEKTATIATPKKMAKQKIVSDTIQVTLRPRRELFERYVIAAADRTRDEKKSISPQQIMLEVLEKGLRVKK